MVRRALMVASMATLSACSRGAYAPPVPSPATFGTDSASWALAKSLAPRLYLQRDEPFPLDRVVAVVHPTEPVIAYHLLWRHDVNGQWLPWAKPSDEEGCTWATIPTRTRRLKCGLTGTERCCTRSGSIAVRPRSTSSGASTDHCRGGSTRTTCPPTRV